ncbi:MAG: DNA helicase UvrD, partial [Candidatus Levybacteria bacterium]|nr:DNA helicase UvrD [Candidatus Levybacteria bacterium]
MEIIADLHLHSKYSRAVSQSMTLPIMAQFARQKGLKLLTTGDWTHPLWLREIRNVLKEENEGIFTLSDGEEKTHFMLSV